jgi:protein O-GlcNAc transferase
MMDFRGLEGRVRTESLRYSTSLFRAGEVAVAGCAPTAALADSPDKLAVLQSWAPELQHLEQQDELHCDLSISEPTLGVKLDATSNMYHHFCDFLNIYLSLQLNQSLTSPPSERQVLILDNHPYHSSFGPAWRAVTTRPMWDLTDVAGKRVCFSDLLLPLLPRMMFGLYYNTPLVPGCRGSSMVRAFSSWLAAGAGAAPADPPRPRQRLTLLSRDTKFRRILNEQQLVSALEETGLYEVRLARFSPAVPFLSQLAVVGRTDLLLGLHGAGLTHLLFLPDWAQVIELYNCEDPECYKDLARLRGVGYSTWVEEALLTRVPGDQGVPHARGPAHKKFANYRFDPAETVRLVGEAARRVRQHKKYLEAVEPRDEL